MKLVIAPICLIVAAATSSVLAEDVVISGTRPSPTTSRDSFAPLWVRKGFDACVETFVARTFPGQQFKYRKKLTYTYMGIEPVGDLDIAIQARLKRDNSKLAEGVCTINHIGPIVRFPIRTAPAAKLAGLTAKDVTLAVTGR
jgi:hypothetical protein